MYRRLSRWSEGSVIAERKEVQGLLGCVEGVLGRFGNHSQDEIM